jgi:hypothetical protein
MFQTNRRAIDVVVEMPKGNHGPWLAALREIDASAEYRLVGLRYLLKDHVIYNSPRAEDYLEHGICFERRSLFLLAFCMRVCQYITHSSCSSMTSICPNTSEFYEPHPS